MCGFLHFSKINKISFGLLLLITTFLLTCIDLPPDPDNPSNSRVNISLKSSIGFTDEQLIIDSVGEDFTISIIRCLPSYITSTALRIESQYGTTEWDTTLPSLSKGYLDTISIVKRMMTVGDRKVIATAHIETDIIRSDTAQLHIISKTNSGSKPSTPQIRVSGKNGDSVTLTWNKVENTNFYTVYRSSTSGNGFTTFKDSLTAEICVVFADSNTTYYNVTASNQSGKSDQSNTVSVTDTDSLAIIDHTCPTIVLKSPDRDSTKISSSSYNVEISCNDESGVASVVCTLGTRGFAVSHGTGNNYSVALTNLTQGLNYITFTAKDSSSNANKTVKTFTIIYDPTIADNVPPVVNLKNPTVNDARIKSLPFFIQISCKDENGIDTVLCICKTTTLAVTKNQDSLYSVQITALSIEKSDTIQFMVTDKSAQHNTIPFSVVVRYNRAPTELVLTIPADGATGISRTPTFTWNGGTDPDNDSVFYRVQYGTNTTSLTSQTAVVIDSSTALPDGVLLEPATAYYWQVIAWTKVYNDTVRSAVRSFTTGKSGPAIVEQPKNQAVKAGQQAYFRVAATGSDLFYQWQKDSTTIPGATSQACTLSQVSASDNDAHFRCMVYNLIDTLFSNSASLIVLHTVTYNANTATGAVPVDTTGYAAGIPVTIKSNADINSGTPIIKTGYAFGGWNTSSSVNGKTYRADGTDTMIMPLAPVTLYAKWVIDTFTVTFTSTGTTVFQTQRITYNGQATIPATQPTLAGYSFEGWYTTNDASGVPFDFSSPVTVNRTLYAKWAQVYSVTYFANGGSGSVPIDSKKYKSSEQVTVSGNTGSLTKANNDFAGWTVNAQGTGTVYNAGDHITVGSEDVNLYVKWTIKQCQITFNAHGGSAVNSQTVSSGSQITEPVSTLSGLTLVGWYTDAGYANRWDFSIVVTSAMTLHAKWEVRDRDGNTYDTVRIGTQTWMVQNLKTTKFRDGTPIPKIEDVDEWPNQTSAAYCWPENNSSLGSIHGARYNHYVVRAANIAPQGWHVPSIQEWQIIYDYIIANELSFAEAPFRATLGGYRESDGTFRVFGEEEAWWTTTSAFGTPEWYCSPTTISTGFYRQPVCGMSIRCIKDQ